MKSDLNFQRWRRGLNVVGSALGLMVGGGELSAQQAVLRMVGTDLLGAEVVTALEQRADEMGRSVRAEFLGSRPAEDRLSAGTADLAVMVAPDPDATWGDGWVAVPLGYFVALVVTKSEVPVEQLNFVDLNRIFGRSSAVASVRWGEFGAAGTWGSVPIAAHVTQPVEGLSQVLFTHRVMADGLFKNSVTQHGTAARTLSAVLEADGGLGIVPRIPDGAKKFKLMMVASGNGQVAFGPTPENIHAGDYPLSVPVKLVFRRERAAELLDWLRFWYGDEMGVILKKTGMVALPVAARNQQVFELEVIQ